MNREAETRDAALFAFRSTTPKLWLCPENGVDRRGRNVRPRPGVGTESRVKSQVACGGWCAATAAVLSHRDARPAAPTTRHTSGRRSRLQRGATQSSRRERAYRTRVQSGCTSVGRFAGRSALALGAIAASKQPEFDHAANHERAGERRDRGPPASATLGRSVEPARDGEPAGRVDRRTSGRQYT